jgi:hypothetical protein
VITARGRKAMDSLYATSDFRVNVPERVHGREGTNRLSLAIRSATAVHAPIGTLPTAAVLVS